MSFCQEDYFATSSDPVSVMDQTSNGSIWCSTATGQLIRFPKELFRSAFTVTTARRSISESLELSPDRILHPRRPLSFEVSVLRVNASDNLAALIGYADNRPVIAIAILSSSCSYQGQKETYTFVQSQGDFIFGRNGKLLQQVCWLPGKDPVYFGVLAGNCFALYNAHSIGIPHATYKLHLADIKNSQFGIGRGNAVDFSFFKDAVDWAAFAVCFLRDDGAVFLLCPIQVPGLCFTKKDASNLVTGNVPDLVLNWHRAVFSRTLLNASSATKETRDQESVIETRDLAQSWNQIPALQGPINSTLEDAYQGFQSILVLSDNRSIVTVSAGGKVLYYSLNGVFPEFQTQSSLSNPPHVLIHYDCYQAESHLQLRLIKDMDIPYTKPKRISICKTGNSRTISIVADCFAATVWIPPLSDSSTEPLMSVTVLNAADLGCGCTSTATFSCRMINSFQMRCTLLAGRHGLSDIVSELPPLENLIQELEDKEVDIEEISLDKLSGLKDRLKDVREGFSDLLRNQENVTSEVSTDIDELCSKLDLLVCDAVVGKEKKNFAELGKRYEYILKKILLSSSDANVKEEVLSDLVKFEKWVGESQENTYTS